MSKIMQITSAVDFGSLHNAVVMINSETAVVGVYQDNHVVIELRSLGYELAIFQYSANTNVKIYLMGEMAIKPSIPAGLCS
ncbi:hypothetical protein QO058_26380 [Bosea vestrisii]|uniref:hypothetical protein n=1 Tax=Bosea vestrisii TaxID=151416 RepID=UPI0024DF4AFF|nr:hypothetical protein [Bosea vestrisii]WID96215.1 hypothetical protein QO058_26380 [Bosea vestrisii]